MTTEELQPGMIVQLRSGGPRMTVTNVVDRRQSGGVAVAECLYFNGAGLSATISNVHRSALTILHWRFRPGDRVVLRDKWEDAAAGVVVVSVPPLGSTDDEMVVAHDRGVDGAWVCSMGRMADYVFQPAAVTGGAL